MGKGLHMARGPDRLWHVTVRCDSVTDHSYKL